MKPLLQSTQLKDHDQTRGWKISFSLHFLCPLLPTTSPKETQGGGGKGGNSSFFHQRESPPAPRSGGAVRGDPGGPVLPGLPCDFRLPQKLWRPRLYLSKQGGKKPAQNNSENCCEMMNANRYLGKDPLMGSYS